jgi:cytochrome c oxidase cbb3-type subunit 1
MTVNRNPKKSRPYDEPPKRRRSLIPGGPDSAATGFFVAAAVWLAIATGIGALALAIRIVPFSFGFDIPLPINPFSWDLAFTLDARRVEYAFLNASVYGWLSNAGFAAVAFMAPRLLGRKLVGETLVNLGMLIWNLALAGGIALLYVLDLGPRAPLAAMPWFVTGGLATGALVVGASYVATIGPVIRTAYVGAWFAGVALLSLMGLLGISATLGVADLFLELGDVTTALVTAFIDRGVVVLWLLGMAYATLHYVVPRATGQPLASGGLAWLTFVTWLVLAPGSVLGVLRHDNIPFVITNAGQVATMLLLVPAALTVVNLVQTMQGRWSLLFGTGAVAFAAVSLSFLIAASLLEALASLRTVDAAVANTEWERGAFLWAAFGTYTMAAFALAEHALPRLLRRAWGGGTLSSLQLYLAFAGVAIAGIGLMGGGLAEGASLAAGTPPADIAAQLQPYRVLAFLGWGLVALAGLAMLVNLFLLYTSGEPAEYAVPGSTAPATATH